MPVSKAQMQAVERYNNANYENVRLRVPAGRKQLIENIADNNNMSINMAINVMLANACGIDYEVWNDPDHKFDNQSTNEINFTVKMRPQCRAMILSKAEEMGIRPNQLVNEAIATYLGFSVAVWNGTYKPNNAAPQQDGKDTE